MSNENNIPINKVMREDESESIKKDLLKYLRYWKWILLGVVVALLTSYIHIRYAPKIYQTSAKIKILKKKESGLDLSGLSNAAPLFDMSTVNLQNEIEVIKSRRIVEEVVDTLNLTVYYFTSGRIKSEEVFGSECPIEVEWLLDGIKTPKETYVYKAVDDNSFNLTLLDKEFNKKFKYGEEINVGGIELIVHKNLSYDFTNKNTSEINFQYKSAESMTGQLVSAISTEPVGDNSQVLEIKLAGMNIKKNEAILNNLINVFNQDGVEDDRQVALKTVQFVSDRLTKLENELDIVESNLVNFRKESDFISEDSGSSLFSTYSIAEQQRAELENQLEISKLVKNEISKNSKFSLLPGITLQNNSTNSLISDYNSLVLEREKLLTSSRESSPQVVEISKQLENLNNNILKSLNDYIKSIEISLQNMSSRESQFDSSISALPEKEKIAREIQRQQAVKENLYIFLLQKQVEADLSAAITAPTAKVVDYAFTPSQPISPKTNIIYLSGLVIGLAFPIGILYIMYLFDSKITSKEQIESKLDVPIIAEIPVNKEYNGKIIKPTDNSNVAEAFRILRTNMNYFNVEQGAGHKCKVIFSTSSTKGEGKTFVAINSASAFASNNSKALLVGCDLRNPQLHSYLGVSKKNIGLSSYLVDRTLKLKDVIFKTEKNLNFDIILSGEIPPNPSELLNNGRLEELIEEAREIYDYVIIDTAPTMLVTDTLAIIGLADAVIYMIRANFTELKILNHIKELAKFNTRKNIGIAINAVDQKKGYEYNYGYGYGYGEDKKVKKWYKFSK